MTATATGVYVKVSAGAEAYALPIEHVLEVAELGAITALPGAGAGVLGVRNFHGQVLPVFDLAHALRATSDEAMSRLVVTEFGGRLAALAVCEVTDVGPLPDDRAESESDYLTEAVLDGGALIGVVDLDALFAALRGRAT